MYTIEPSYYVMGAGVVLYILQMVTRRKLFAKYVLAVGIIMFLLALTSLGVIYLIGGPRAFDA